VATFGWDDLELTDDDRARHERAEALTNELMEPAFATLDEAGRMAMLTGLERIGAAMT
jgi:hypothetical protein